MRIQEYLKQKKISVYRLAKESGLPYMTVNDICRGSAKLEKCSAETVYRIAKALDVSMEELLEPYLIKRSSFENFKSSVCHRLKAAGDIDFMIELLESQDIRMYYSRKWYLECFYLLAMLDYLSRENDVPLCEDYNDLRQYKLEQTVYPAGVLAMAAAADNDAILEEAKKSSIPEFMQFNIVENEVRNVA